MFLSLNWCALPFLLEVDFNEKPNSNTHTYTQKKDIEMNLQWKTLLRIHFFIALYFSKIK